MAGMPPKKPMQTPEQTQEIRFPLAGVNQSNAFSNQPNNPMPDGDYARTAPIGVNVRSFDPSTDRKRGGARPGIQKFIQGQVSGTNNIQNLASVVVTEGIVPGSGTQVLTFMGILGLLDIDVDDDEAVPVGLGSYNALLGEQTDTAASAFSFFSYSVSARAFASGGGNQSYTSLAIPDGTGVTVSLGLTETQVTSGTSQYVMAVNGKRFASAPFTLPGTLVDTFGGAVCLRSSSYHIVIGIQRGGSAGQLMACAIDDAGSVAWSNVSVGLTLEVLTDGQYQYGIGAVVTAASICCNLPGATGVIKFDLADGTNGVTLATNAQIATNAGTGYSNAKNLAITPQSIAVASGVLAVTVEGTVTVAGVPSKVNGLVFPTVAAGTFTYTAVTGLTTSPAMPTTVSTHQYARVVSDGTDFYVLVYTSGGSFVVTSRYLPVLSKYSGTTGSLLWTVTLSDGPRISMMVYLSGLNSLQIYGTGYSISVNPSTGAIDGGGVLPGTQTYYAMCDAGSVTLDPETVSTGQASGPLDILTAVSAGTVKVAYGGSWRSVTSGSSALSTTAPVIRSASFNGKIYYADGSSRVCYNPSTNSVETWAATAGDLPVDPNGAYPRLIAVQGGRLWLAALPADPRNWFASAKGDATNFDYGPVEPSGSDAVAGNSPQFEGDIGEPITALIPYTDDVMIFGMTNTISMLRGNPAEGGRIDLLSNSTGIAFGDAWCMDPFGTIYFFSNYRAVYKLIPGEKPVRISQAIDNLFKNIDLRTTIVRLQWDDVFQGFHVFATPFASAQATQHYFYEIRSGSWWSSVFANVNHSPLAVHNFSGNTSIDHVSLIGSWDGIIRTFSSTAASDDGTPIASEIWIGPIASKNLDENLWKECQAVLGEQSGTVTFEIMAGRTAEGAMSGAAVASGAWTAGRNLNTPIRCAAHALYVRITSTVPWSMESIRVLVALKGKVRQRGY